MYSQGSSLVSLDESCFSNLRYRGYSISGKHNRVNVTSSFLIRHWRHVAFFSFFLCRVHLKTKAGEDNTVHVRALGSYISLGVLVMERLLINDMHVVVSSLEERHGVASSTGPSSVLSRTRGGLGRLGPAIALPSASWTCLPPFAKGMRLNSRPM